MPCSLPRLFWRHKAGNVAIITALAALPMLGLLGLCIDFGIALLNKTKLDAAADAAAVIAITAAQDAIDNNAPDPLSIGEARGQAAFKANVGAIGFGKTPNPVVKLTQAGTNITASVTYVGSNQMQFGSLFGSKTAKITGGAGSTLSSNKYINIYLVVDVSNSMGIAATTADMNKLYSLTGCVFACHGDYEKIAHNNGVTLRLDVVRSSMKNLINKVKSSAGSKSHVAIGVYTFEDNLNILSLPTTNYDSLLASISDIDKFDLGSDTSLASDTHTAISLAQLNIPRSGNGSSPTSTENFVFIMTDGTSDTYNAACLPAGHSHCITPYDQAWVAQLKTNATVGIIYTTYLPFYQNNDPAQGFDPNYDLFIAPINQPKNSLILKNLKLCASDEKWFKEASDSVAIDNALNALLAQSYSAAHLTN